MADEDGVKPGRNEALEEQPPHVKFHMELCESLPGGRAVVGVERNGEFTWLASKEHVSEQARDEFVDQLSRMAREGWLVQVWPGR